MRALVKAANDMQIAAMPTQMALLDAGGEYCSVVWRLPPAGTRFCPPPLPVCSVSRRSGRVRTSDPRGGSVAAINSECPLPQPSEWWLVSVRGGQRLLWRILHDVIRAGGGLHAKLISIGIDDGIIAAKIVPRRGRRHNPFQRSAFPRIWRSRGAAEAAVDQIKNEKQLHGTGDNGGHGDELMYRNKGFEVIVGKSSVAAHVAGPAKVVERHEDAVGADEGEPEMDFPDRFIEHVSGHLREPEVGSRKDTEHGRNTHDHVEVADHEVSSVEHDVDGRLRQEKATDPTANKHGDKTESKQRGGIYA